MCLRRDARGLGALHRDRKEKLEALPRKMGTKHRPEIPKINLKTFPPGLVLMKDGISCTLPSGTGSIQPDAPAKQP